MSVSEMNEVNGNGFLRDVNFMNEIAIRNREIGTLQAQLSNAREAIGEHKAENAALDAAHERLKGAARRLVDNGVGDDKQTVVPSYWFDRLAKEVDGAAGVEPSDVINPELEAPLPPGSWRRVGADWFNRLQAKMDEVDYSWSHDNIREVLSVWEEGNLPFVPPEPSMFDSAEIIRGQSERIRELEERLEFKSATIENHERDLAYANDFAKKSGAEMARYAEANRGFREENDRLETEVCGLRAENCELLDNVVPFPLPKEGHGPSQPAAPCLFAYRRLADAARQLIWANRRGELAASHVNVLDFALDGVSCGGPVCGGFQASA